MDPSKPGVYGFRGSISQYIKETLDKSISSSSSTKDPAKEQERYSIEKEIAAAGASISKQDEDIYSSKIKSILNLNEQSEANQIN